MTSGKIKITTKNIDEITDLAKGLIHSVRGPIDGKLLLLAGLERWLLKKGIEVSFEVEVNETETYHETVGED